MSLIDDIKKDREAGTPGEWFGAHFARNDHRCNCRSILGEYGGMGALATISVAESDVGPWGDDVGPNLSQAQANARRIVRVPDMETALLAAEELARDLTLWIEAVDCYVIPGEIRKALGSYREATKNTDDN